jgi:hypothetical protein
MLGEIAVERLKAGGIQTWDSDARSVGPRGKLRCPKQTPTDCARGETALLKPLTKAIKIRPGQTRGVRCPRPFPCEIGREHTALLRYKVRKDGSNMLRKSGR